ncbi:MAG TPA: DUF1236 domain-containing protein [Xanthobacteraceae bacterium]|nr:DUF1236 domain-containing protein [Xanthobacteraceae bacterium]
MRKNTLMIAAAVAALTAGSTLAIAQGGPDAKSNPASKSAPAEKMAPSSAAKPGGAEHAQMPGGQRGEERGAAQNHMQGQGAGERSTVGQGQMNERSKGGLANERNEKAGQKAGEAAQERNSKTKSETTGQAPSQAAPQANPKQEKAKGNERKKFEGNARREPNRAEQRERNRSTTGQGAPENRGGAMQNREQGGVEQNRTNEGRSGTSTSVEGRSSSSTSVNLTTEQKQKIHTVIIADRSAPRVEHVDFDVRVGTVVPRGKVHFAPVPSSIVEIEPVWRGFEYFLVGDEIVIVDPADLHIVAVIPA